MVEAMVGIISIIVGTVLGFLLSEQGAKRREERIEVPLTEFKRAAFESQLYLLGLSLPEQELTRVFLFYDCLSKIEALRNTSTIAYQEQQESWNLASQGKGFVRRADV